MKKLICRTIHLHISVQQTSKVFYERGGGGCEQHLSSMDVMVETLAFVQQGPLFKSVHIPDHSNKVA